MTDDRWQMTDDRLQIADDRWQMPDDRWWITHDRWQMTDDRWWMTHDRWHTTQHILNWYWLVLNSKTKLVLLCLYLGPLQHILL